jgi:hypothetical protein
VTLLEASLGTDLATLVGVLFPRSPGEPEFDD